MRIALTAEGRRVIGEVQTAARAYLSAVLRRLSEPQVRRLVATFDEFADAAQAVQREGEGSA